MIINHNMPALNTYNRLSANNTQTSKSLEKLSSGLRINRAGDDAAGLAISEKMRGQIRGLDQAQRNAQDSISMIQTAEGALNETHSILQRMRELAVQAANDTNTKVDRGEIQKEINQLTDEIDRIANTTEFNTQKLIDGSKKGLVSKENSQVSAQVNSKQDLRITGDIPTDIASSGVIIITRGSLASASFATGSADKDNWKFDATDDIGFSIYVGGQLTTTGVSISGNTITLATGKTIDLANDLTKMASGESVTITVKASIAESTKIGDSFNMQIGANSGQNIIVGIKSMKTDNVDGLKLRQTYDGKEDQALQVGDYYKATSAVSIINNAIETVSAERSKLGSIQNRLEHTISNLNTSSENLTAAESRIRDVDMAKEMMAFQKNNILSQAAQAMLAQANQQPQGVLQLLR